MMLILQPRVVHSQFINSSVGSHVSWLLSVMCHLIKGYGFRFIYVSAHLLLIIIIINYKNKTLAHILH